MSKQSTIEDCGGGLKHRSSQRNKPATSTELASEATDSMAAVLSELQSLRTTIVSINTKISTVDDFGSKLDKVDKRLTEMNGSFAAVQKSFAELQKDITANAKRLTEAESRIGATEDDLNSVKAKLANAAERIAFLETKTENLENYGRRKNLRLVGLPEGTEKNRPLVEYLHDMIPLWLRLDPSKSFVLERAHRTLARPRPGQNRAVIIRFLQFQDRELVFRTSKQIAINHEGHKIFFAQDFSAETMKARRPFDTVNKKYIEAGSFRGFQQQSCKMRILHDGKIILFSTPQEAENFLLT